MRQGEARRAMRRRRLVKIKGGIENKCVIKETEMSE